MPSKPWSTIPYPENVKQFKRCPRCGETKPKEDFGMRGTGKFLKSLCRPCAAAKSREAGKKHPEKVSKQNKRFRYRIYGMTESDYQQMLTAQNGVCAICGDPPKKRSLAIDHCHSRMFVRDLLCDRCNHLLGAARDNELILNNAIKYLQKWKSAQPEKLIPETYRHRLSGNERSR